MRRDASIVSLAAYAVPRPETPDLGADPRPLEPVLRGLTARPVFGDQVQGRLFVDYALPPKHLWWFCAALPAHMEWNHATGHEHREKDDGCGQRWGETSDASGRANGADSWIIG